MKWLAPAPADRVVTEQQMVRSTLSIEAGMDEASEPWALSDIEPHYLHRAIRNLVANASRYAADSIV